MKLPIELVNLLVASAFFPKISRETAAGALGLSVPPLHFHATLIP